MENDMYVCLCGDVRESQIRNAIRENEARTLTDMMDKLMVCCGCGTCQQDVVGILFEELNKLDTVA